MKCDLGRLSNEITFGVNGIFLIYDKIGFEPTYYCVEDHLVYEDRWREINAQVNRSTAFFPAQFRTVDFDKTNYRFFRALYEMENYRNWPAFSQDCGRYLWIGGTVTYVCIQLAYHMGFSEVYLLGIDHNYARPAHVESKGTVWTSHGDDPNHFHPQYFGTGRRWHDPRVDRMEKAYVRAREVFHKRGRRIANATIGGRLEVFERVDYDQLFFR
jgi:hypothetical protein